MISNLLRFSLCRNSLFLEDPFYAVTPEDHSKDMHSALLKLSNGHLFRIVPNAAVLHLVLGRKRLCDLLHHIRAAGLDHIIPGADTERRHADASAPVCHNKALKAPLIPEDCSSQVIVICRRHTIDIVVGGHYTVGLCLLHRQFKALQIDFPQGTLGNNVVGIGPQGLLIIARKVLHGNAHAVFLDALCRVSPARAVYISCNPETQRRDLEYLSEQGWKVESIQGVDMFPHTQHIETVALLTRTRAAHGKKHL